MWGPAERLSCYKLLCAPRRKPCHKESCPILLKEEEENPSKQNQFTTTDALGINVCKK